MKRAEAFEVRLTEVVTQERTMAQQHLTLLVQNTELTREIARLTAELHGAICRDGRCDG